MSISLTTDFLEKQCVSSMKKLTLILHMVEDLVILSSDLDLSSLIMLGAFAGCYFNESLVTAALYRKDESSRVGCLQEPVEGPCNRWAKANSSKQHIKKLLSKEQSGREHNPEDDLKLDSPPQYRISLQASDLRRGRQSNAQLPPHISNATAKKHGNVQAFLPAMPRFDRIAPNEHPVAYAQGRPTQPWGLANSSRSTIYSPAIMAVDPAFLANYAPREQQFNLTHGASTSNPQMFYPMPTLQQSHSEIFDSFQLWPSNSSQTGTWTAGSSSISSSPYLTPPSTGGSTSFHTERLQPAASDRHLFFSATGRRTAEDDPDMHRESESSSCTSTPRKDRTLLDGPIIIKSDDKISM